MHEKRLTLASTTWLTLGITLLNYYLYASYLVHLEPPRRGTSKAACDDDGTVAPRAARRASMRRWAAWTNIRAPTVGSAGTCLVQPTVRAAANTAPIGSSFSYPPKLKLLLLILMPSSSLRVQLNTPLSDDDDADCGGRAARLPLRQRRGLDASSSVLADEPRRAVKYPPSGCTNPPDRCSAIARARRSLRLIVVVVVVVVVVSRFECGQLAVRFTTSSR